MTYDVIVVGAGPTGLTLAGDLAAAGVRTLLLERRAETSNLTRAFAVHARTMEQLDARGLADALIPTGTVVGQVQLFGRFAINLRSLPSRYAFLLVTPQYEVERLLHDRAVRAGARIETGAEVTGLSQDDRQVTVTTAGGAYTASYVVGTDGVRSRVRAALGVPFPGRAVLRSIALADVRLTDAPTGVLTVNSTGDCLAFVAPFGDGWYRVLAWDRTNLRPDSDPVGIDEIRAITRRALGTDFGMHDPRWLSRFHSDERQAPRYRVGRVFLAGDAAHVHSPAGGQGMNVGIQDACNLGWKLAAAVHGWAPAGLLDTYEAERHPIGRDVLRSSGALLRLATLHRRPQRALRNAVGAVALRIPAISRRAAGTVSAIDVGYPGAARAADRALAGGGRLYTELRHGTFVLLGPSDLARTATPWSGRVRTAVPAGHRPTAQLVRPDGYLAWSGSAAGARAALATHCGPPPTGRPSTADQRRPAPDHHPAAGHASTPDPG